MKFSPRQGLLLAITAAALYALNAPASKLLLDAVPATLMAGFLYVGAGLGMAVVAGVRWLAQRQRVKAGKHRPLSDTEPFQRSDIPFVLAMIGLDVAAPILLMLGLARTSAAGASLLNNFEIVATALVALGIFREAVSPRLWAGIGCVTVACALLSVEGGTTVDAWYPSVGSLLILGACLCWGVENNCTRRLSKRDPLKIVLLKGVFSGSASVVIGLCLGERIESWTALSAVLLVGFVAYGLSIFCYVYAQRMLGAARTGAYYAIAPFIGTALSLLIFREMPPMTYFVALAVMAVGVWLSSADEPIRKTLSRYARRDRS